MTLQGWTILLGLGYLALLLGAAVRSWQRGRTADEFMFAGRRLGVRLGVLTYAAALFSAFTFLGMPDFFRTHGVGSWIFLAVSDAMMVFFVVLFGTAIRRRARELGFNGMAGMMAQVYERRWVGWAMFASAFIFLVPYVAIQIRGIAVFFASTFPDLLSLAQWSALIVLIMLGFSEIGGFRAIVFADAIQGLSLLVILWILAGVCTSRAGGWSELWTQVRQAHPELCSVPGPKGLFTVQFLLASAIAIVMIPATQPQMSTRLVVMKSTAALHRMAVSVGVFAMAVIFPTALIGMYGAIRYTGLPAAEFQARALLLDQPPWLGGLSVIGLLAACLSTTNAQLFALGTELRSMLHGDDRQVLRRTRWAIFGFAAIVFIFSIVMSDQLVLLARTSFAGTAMMGPLVLAAVAMRHPPRIIAGFSAIAMLLFFVSQLLRWPDQWLGIRLDLGLLVLLAILSCAAALLCPRRT
jgi:SSS family solute:Na+ symporter